MNIFIPSRNYLRMLSCCEFSLATCRIRAFRFLPKGTDIVQCCLHVCTLSLCLSLSLSPSFVHASGQLTTFPAAFQAVSGNYFRVSFVMSRRDRRQDSRSRSRGRVQPQRYRSRSRPTSGREQSRRPFLPQSWNSTSSEYDSNREYGLNLPRKVLSNRFTRELNIDGMDIMDVRLSQVTTGGTVNWGLRSLANGRHTVFESFKSRQEAIMAGTLM